MKVNRLIPSILISISVLSAGSIEALWEDTRAQGQVVAQADSEAVEQPMTVDDIQAITEEIEEVLAQQDVEGVLQYFAPFIVSETITETATGVESVILEGVEQHQEMLEVSLGEPEAEESPEAEILYERETIRITPNGQLATLVAINASEVTSEEGLLVITTTDTVRMARIDGQIKIISFTNRSQIMPHSSEE